MIPPRLDPHTMKLVADISRLKTLWESLEPLSKRARVLKAQIEGMQLQLEKEVQRARMQGPKPEPRREVQRDGDGSSVRPRDLSGTH